MNKSWTNEEDEILRQWVGIIPHPKIAESYLPNRTASAVEARCMILKLKSGLRSAPRKYKAYNDFFSIPDIQNSYWAGFIAADGCVRDLECYSSYLLQIKLSIKDRHHLTTFKNVIGFTGPISDGITNKGHDYSIIRISCSRQIIKDLNTNFNITSRKTFTIEPPTSLSLENSLAFIKGYLDGDGHFTIHRKRGIENLYVGFCGREVMMMWIKETLQQICPWEITSKLFKNENIYQLTFGGKKAVCVADKMDKMPTNYLLRKWSILREFNEKYPRFLDQSKDSVISYDLNP